MWSKIIGHDRQIEQLRRALAAGRLPNAYILSGPEGLGKRMVADALAAAIVCPDSASRDQDACGSCPACRKLASGNHPDIFAIAPEESERGAQRSIKIDALRDLIGRLMYKPLEAPAKIAIIDCADRLMPAAANSLLKCLEEPPEATHFILVTPLPHKLLPTIRSRCQLIPFSPLAESAMAPLIAERQSIGIEEALRIAALSGGSIGIALRLEPEFVSEVIGRFLPLTARASSADIIEAAQAFKSLDAEKIPLVFDILTSWYRDILRIRSGDVAPAIHPEAASAAERLTEGRAMSNLAKINAARLTADTAANKQLMFENLLFTLTG